MKNIVFLAFIAVVLGCSCNGKSGLKSGESTVPPPQSKWILTSLNGKPITNNKCYIQFLEGQRFSAYAGCNAMGGEYKIEDGNRVSFSKMMSTMMACEDMKIEQELAAALETTDAFVLENKTLQLNKAKIPLAVFELHK